MITAQEIREKTFDKATFGGYDMNGVDDYLETLAADVTSTQKEILTLRAKMKVLVDKIEEYRANESAMNKALLAAQRLAACIESEANEKAAAVIAEANEKAEAIIADANEQYRAATSDLTGIRELEERRLAAAKEAGAAYFEKAFADLDRQKEFLTAIANLGNETAEEPVTEEIAEVMEEVTEETVAEAAEEVAELAEAVAEEVTEEVEAVPSMDDEVDEPTRMFRF